MREHPSFRERVLLFFIPYLGALIIWVMGITWRLCWGGEEYVQAARAASKNVIYAFWHGRLLPLCFSHRKRRIHVMVSEHRDGEIIARIIHLLGFVPVRGSTTQGGLKALLKMAQRASAGYDAAITPDGPKGPNERAQLGIITLAQRTGMPIIPLANAASFRKILSSWDKFLIPFPFSRVVILSGPPIYVPRELTEEGLEKKRIEVEQAITALTRRADRFFL